MACERLFGAGLLFAAALSGCGLGGAAFHAGAGGRSGESGGAGPGGETSGFGGGSAAAAGGSAGAAQAQGGAGGLQGTGSSSASGGGGQGQGGTESTSSSGSSTGGGSVSVGSTTGGLGGSPGAGGGGAGAGGGTSSSSGGGGQDPQVTGCSDGSREYFVDLEAHPKVAGCAGAFSVPGVTTGPSRTPQCGRQSGNDGANASGEGCSVEDLCAEGWHVCLDQDEFDACAPEGCIAVESGLLSFWLTRQVQDERGRCVDADKGENNLVGCGSLGLVPTRTDGCEPLDAYLNYASCVGPWRCGQTAAGEGPVLNEAAIVTKISYAGGGVLCCQDR